MHTPHSLRTLLVIAGLLMAGMLPVYAQPTFGLYGVMTQPTRIFHDSAYTAGGGISIEVMSNNLLGPRSKVFLQLGGGVDFSWHGKDKYRVTLDNTEQSRATLSVMNRQIPIHLVARFGLDQGPVQPYMDLFAGGRFIFTEERIKPDHTPAGYEDKTTRDVITSPTFVYGAGLGCMFPLADWVKLDMRATYSAGSTASYQVLDNVQQNSNEIRYRYTRTATDQWIFRAGFVFTLKPDPNPQPRYTERSRNELPNTTRSSTPKRPNVVKPNPPKREPIPMH